MIEENVTALLREIKENPFGEKVTLVAATKTRTEEEIRRAIGAGITDVGENRVQEFTAKYDAFEGARRHFIGRLQLNKVKYLMGTCDLIHSVDRDPLAFEISRRSPARQDVLIQINIGNEESKGGYPLEEGGAAYLRLRNCANLHIRGFMAMLPNADDPALLKTLCKKMRSLFERVRESDPDADILSMGMSGDFRLCVECGSNMVRLGTAIFGERK